MKVEGVHVVDARGDVTKREDVERIMESIRHEVPPLMPATTNAIIASPIGMNRGKRQGSCRPPVRIVVGSPDRVTVG